MPTVYNSLTNAITDKRCWTGWPGNPYSMVFCWKTEKGWDNESLTHTLLPYMFQLRRDSPLYFQEGKCRGLQWGLNPLESSGHLGQLSRIQCLHRQNCALLSLEGDFSGQITHPACLLSDPTPHHTHQCRCLSFSAVSDKVPRKDWVSLQPSQSCKTSAKAPG